MGMSETDNDTLAKVQVYSIGHSAHSMEEFVMLLHQHGIAVIVDVRSQPYSRWAPHFNRESLARALQTAGVGYHFMGDSLGGRPANRDFYEDGQEAPDYTLLAQSDAFREGIERLLELAATDRVAMMCAEGDYRNCHRSKLITPALLQHGARVFHIHPDGTVSEAQPEPQQLTLL
jgi:uncharacterized protein (DUF488 family)